MSISTGEFHRCSHKLRSAEYPSVCKPTQGDTQNSKGKIVNRQRKPTKKFVNRVNHVNQYLYKYIITRVIPVIYPCYPCMTYIYTREGSLHQAGSEVVMSEKELEKNVN